MVDACGDVCTTRLVATDDGGETWEERTNPRDSFVPAFRFLDPGRGWVQGTGECDVDGRCGKVFYRTTDGGRTWSETHRTAPSWSASFASAFAVTGDLLIAADGESGIVHGPLEGGALVEAVTPARAGLGTITFFDAAEGLAQSGGLQRTDDGGTTWTMGAWPEALNVAVVRDDAVWALPWCPNVCPRYAWRSLDRGVSWERRELPIEAGDLQAVDAEHAWVRTLEATYRTDDGGVTWQPISNEFGLLAPVYVTPDFGWARYCVTVPCNGRFTVTTDGGETYEERPLPNERTDIAFFIDASTGWAWSYEPDASRGGSGTRIWRTLDGGRTWGDMGVAELQIAVQSAHFVDPQRGWALGFEPTGDVDIGGMSWIVSTVDGGRTWVREFAPEQEGFRGYGQFASAGGRLWYETGITDNPWNGGRTVLYRREIAATDDGRGVAIAPPDTGFGEGAAGNGMGALGAGGVLATVGALAIVGAWRRTRSRRTAV